jgi:hypothetical protein
MDREFNPCARWSIDKKKFLHSLFSARENCLGGGIFSLSSELSAQDTGTGEAVWVELCG